jgi:hypothetical protein
MLDHLNTFVERHLGPLAMPPVRSKRGRAVPAGARALHLAVTGRPGGHDHTF